MCSTCRCGRRSYSVDGLGKRQAPDVARGSDPMFSTRLYSHTFVNGGCHPDLSTSERGCGAVCAWHSSQSSVLLHGAGQGYQATVFDHLSIDIELIPRSFVGAPDDYHSGSRHDLVWVEVRRYSSIARVAGAVSGILTKMADHCARCLGPLECRWTVGVVGGLRKIPPGV